MESILLVIFGVGCLLLRAGFALQVSGSLRAKNSAAAVVRLTAETAAAVIAFWGLGAGILFQTRNNWLAFDPKYLFCEPAGAASKEFFHLTVFLIAGSIVSGAIAERSKFYVGVIASAVLAGFVLPVVGHWVWYGWLLNLYNCRFVDCGGATVIHLTGAIFGAIGIGVVGSRAGKYNRDGSSSSIPGHSLPMLCVGVMLLLAGWFPYLLGCVIAHGDVADPSDVELAICATNILLAGAGGVAGGLIYSQWRYRKPDLFFIYSGLLGGLVAISSGLLAVNNGFGAILIGLVAGIIIPMIALLLDLNARMDDPIGLIAIHGVGAIWGTLATAIFIPFEHFSDHFKQLAIQCGGLAAVMLFSAIFATALFLLLRQLKWLRVTDADEFDGLDIGEHDIYSYPDFQQTSIKSYHLREA